MDFYLVQFDFTMKHRKNLNKNLNENRVGD